MKNIVLVEDDKFLVKLYKLKLEEQGYKVSYFESGEGFLKSLESLPFFDLAIIDIMLPDVDGFYILEALKIFPMLVEKPIIVLSALGEVEDVEKAKNLGARAFFTKSEIDIKKFTDSIADYLK